MSDPMSLLKLFLGGLIAAYLQLSIVVFASVLTLSSLVLDAESGGDEVSRPDPFVDPLRLATSVQLLRWIVFASAVGAALTSTYCIDDSAYQIRKISQSLGLAEPKNVIWALFIEFSLAAIGCGILVFITPPLLLILLCYRLYGISFVAWIAWSGLMSIGAAFFGASAHAAAQELQ